MKYRQNAQLRTRFKLAARGYAGGVPWEEALKIADEVLRKTSGRAPKGKGKGKHKGKGSR